MYCGKFEVGNVGINFEGDGYITPQKYFEYSDRETSLQLKLFNGHVNQSISGDRKLTVMHQESNMHLFKRLMCYMLDLYSSEYSAIHGSGISLDNKGILFTGPSGHGKSTLAKAFSNSQILDDDLLILTENKMGVSGKFGTRTIKKEEYSYLKPIKGKNAIKSHQLDFAFLLDKRFKGGYCNEVENVIPRMYSHLTISPMLTRKQRLLKNSEVNARVFVLGTNGNLEKTKESIEEIISS